MQIKHFITILALFAFAVAPASVHAGGVVTICDEAHLLAALANGGTVTFACSGTVTLTNTVTIAADTVIDGNGQDVTISGNNAVRVFTVNSGVALRLNRVTVADGNVSLADGAGIRNFGTLIVTTSNFSSNRGDYAGGGISNYGVLTVTYTAFSNNYSSSSGAGISSAAAGPIAEPGSGLGQAVSSAIAIP